MKQVCATPMQFMLPPNIVFHTTLTSFKGSFSFASHVVRHQVQHVNQFWRSDKAERVTWLLSTAVDATTSAPRQELWQLFAKKKFLHTFPFSSQMMSSQLQTQQGTPVATRTWLWMLENMKMMVPWKWLSEYGEDCWNNCSYLMTVYELLHYSSTSALHSLKSSRGL